MGGLLLRRGGRVRQARNDEKIQVGGDLSCTNDGTDIFDIPVQFPTVDETVAGPLNEEAIAYIEKFLGISFKAVLCRGDGTTIAREAFLPSSKKGIRFVLRLWHQEDRIDKSIVATDVHTYVAGLSPSFGCEHVRIVRYCIKDIWLFLICADGTAVVVTKERPWNWKRNHTLLELGKVQGFSIKCASGSRYPSL